jgi:uroporphyrinogen-III synthase
MISSLHNWGVLVTRPAAQAGELCRLLEVQGACVLRFPTLAIEPLPDPAVAGNIIRRLADYDIAIFISANAVEQALSLIGSDMPDGLQLAVIGNASAQALRLFGLQPDLAPAHDFNSEALLALEALQRVQGRRIVIFRGQGGRGLLGETLQQRGAQVDYAEVYRRVRPANDPAGLISAWQRGAVQAVTITSNESLQNLCDMLGPQVWPWLRETPLVVVSGRTRELARELGFQQTIETAGEPGDQAIVEALIRLRQRLESHNDSNSGADHSTA